MRKSQLSEEQVAMAIHQAEAGTPVAEIPQRLQISEQMFDRWKK